MATQVTVTSPPFTFWPLRWLIVFLVFLVCFLIVLGLVPPDPKTAFICIGALALAILF